MGGRLRRAANVRDDEVAVIRLIALVFAALEAGRGLGEVGVNTLVLSRLSADALPWLYIPLGAISLVIAVAFGAALGRVAKARLFGITLVAVGGAPRRRVPAPGGRPGRRPRRLADGHGRRHDGRDDHLDRRDLVARRPPGTTPLPDLHGRGHRRLPRRQPPGRPDRRRRRCCGARRHRGTPVRRGRGRDRAARRPSCRRPVDAAADGPPVGRRRRPGRVRRGPPVTAAPAGRGRLRPAGDPPLLGVVPVPARGAGRLPGRGRTRADPRHHRGDHHRDLVRRLARRRRPVLPAVRHRRRGAPPADRLPRWLRAVDRVVHVRDGRGVHDRPAGDPARDLERGLGRDLQRPAVDPPRPGDRVHGRGARADRHGPRRRPAPALDEPARAGTDLLARVRGGRGLCRGRGRDPAPVCRCPACGRSGAGSASRSSRAGRGSATCSTAPDVRAALIAAMQAPDAGTREMAAVLLARSPERRCAPGTRLPPSATRLRASARLRPARSSRTATPTDPRRTGPRRASPR